MKTKIIIRNIILLLICCIVFESCLTTAVLAVVGVVGASGSSKQNKKEKPTVEMLQAAMKQGRQPGQGYRYAEWAKESDYSRNRFKKEVEKLGYVYIDDENYKCFLPKSELKNYEKEKEYQNFGGVVNKNLRGTEFKSIGSANLYNLQTKYGIFTYSWSGEFFKCSNIHWTGNVKNGLLDGKGDGYVVRKFERRKDECYTISGEFKNGNIVKVSIDKVDKAITSWGEGIEKYSVFVNNTPSEGLRSYGVENTKKEESYEGFLDNNNQHVGGKYDKVIKNFVNGKAVVCTKGMNYTIDKNYKFVNIAEGSTAIASRVLEDNKNLKSITIPASVKSIGKKAFKNCSNLTSVKIMGKLDEIGPYAFSGCESLRTIDLRNYTGTELNACIFEHCNKLESVVLPSTIKIIGLKAFFGCSSLKTFKFPSSIKEVQSQAFGNCSSLTSVTFFSNITHRGDQVFGGCSKLKKINFNIKGSVRNDAGDKYWFVHDNRFEQEYAAKEAKVKATKITDFDYETGGWVNDVMEIKFFEKKGFNTYTYTGRVYRDRKGPYLYTGLSYTRYDSWENLIIALYTFEKYGILRLEGIIYD